MNIELFGKIYHLSWRFPWVRRVRVRKITPAELQKLKPPSVSDEERLALSTFYCIVCKEMKTGSSIASHEYGGWVCAWHTDEQIEAAKPPFGIVVDRMGNEFETSDS